MILWFCNDVDMCKVTNFCRKESADPAIIL